MQEGHDTPPVEGTVDGRLDGSDIGRQSQQSTQSVRTAKAVLRRQLLTARRQLPAATLTAAGPALSAALLGLPRVSSAGTVACYVSMGNEPPTTALLQELRTSGRRVLLPVLTDDRDLDWAAYDGPDALRQGRAGVWEPTGPRLGRDAVGGADVVVAPGLAAGADGMRLGRGGGSYDRALSRLPASCPVVVLLHDGELLAAVPSEPHDRRVDVAVTPGTVRTFG